MQSQTSYMVSVRIDVEPNSVEHTSPDRFEDAEKEYLAVLQKDPNNAVATFNLAVLYNDHMNKQVEAKRNFRKYSSLVGGSLPADHIVNQYLSDKVQIRPVEKTE